MRRRLMMAFIGLIAGVLVVAGAGSLILTRNAARNQAQAQLVTESQSLATGAHEARSLKVLAVIKRVLKLEDARTVRVSILGQLVTAPPQGVTSADLDPTALLAGQTVQGRDGDVVFAATPIPLTAAERVRLRLHGQLAIVLTRDVGDLGPSWAYFTVAGGGALVIAALVAWQLSRRMSRPVVEATAVTQRIAAGDLDSRVVVRAGDYSELVTLARSINEMAQNLGDGRERERNLLLAVSHDLRTPLTSIRGFAEAITDGAVEDNAHAAEVIVAESRRLERLVGDLLDLAKLEAHQLSITMRPTDAAEVMSTTAEGFRPLAERNGIALMVDEPPMTLDPVDADPDRLAQMLANLMENALTYASSAVTVRLAPSANGTTGGTATVTVEDDGPGIAPTDLERVFERFYRADRGPNRRVGSGLGLAIVSELASAMGAGVHVESPAVPGRGGSRFVVTLPLATPGAS